MTRIAGVPARIAWVWRDGLPSDPKAPAVPAGVDGLLVRAANGTGYTGSGGFSYRASYAAWAARAGAAHCGAWTWLGPPTSSDGRAAADALHTAAPAAPYYVADVEGALSRGQATAFVRRLAELAPGRPVGFSSYPTRAQAVRFGVPWDELVDVCQFSAPQVYWPAQRAQLAQVLLDHHRSSGAALPVHVAVSPTDDPGGWLTIAREGVGRLAGTSVWRLGLPGALGWMRSLPVPSAPAPAPAPKPRPRPVARTYTVRAGDTLSGIAGRLHVAGGWQSLYRLNRTVIGANPNLIRAGQVLRLP